MSPPLLCLNLSSSVFTFKARTRKENDPDDWIVCFVGSQVEVQEVRTGELFRYRILDKSLKPCETHARRILAFASGGSDMPMQNVRNEFKPCLEKL